MSPIKFYKQFKRVKKLLSFALKGQQLLRWFFRLKAAEKLYRALTPFLKKTPYTASAIRPDAARSIWSPPERAKPYLRCISIAEGKYNLPNGLLARLIYQECRYRPDIIDGRVISSAGAMGIAQIVPRWHPEAKPLDPEHSIDYAARYLSQLYKQFGDWQSALAAYNWGPGNVSRAKKQHGSGWLRCAPTETRNYVSQIGRDTGLG